MKTYLVSDTHLNHAKIKTYCQRPDDFTERINHNIQAIVKSEDLLIHLGDVGMDKEHTWTAATKAWPGRKVLVRGNHDNKSCQWYMENAGFHFACDAMIYRGAWLTHKPWLGELPEGTHVNVHGHLHNVWDGFHCEADPEKENFQFVEAARSGKLLKPWHRLFAIEYTDYRPVDFDKFIAKPDKYEARGRIKPRAAKVDVSEFKFATPEDVRKAHEVGWDRDTGNGFNERGYSAGHGIYHDPMG